MASPGDNTLLLKDGLGVSSSVAGTGDEALLYSSGLARGQNPNVSIGDDMILGSATKAQGGAEGLIIDDFERGNLDPYEDPFHGGKDYWHISTFAWSGQYAAEHTTEDRKDGIASMDGLPRYPSQGVKFAVRAFIGDSSNQDFGYGVQAIEEDPGATDEYFFPAEMYYLYVHSGRDTMAIFKRQGTGSPSTVAESTNTNVPLNQWTDWVVTWQPDGTQIFELYNEQGEVVNSIQGKDSDYADGGIWLYKDSKNVSNTVARFDHARIIEEL